MIHGNDNDDKYSGSKWRVQDCAALLALLFMNNRAEKEMKKAH